MTEEYWKDIEGYEGLYQVSNLGRVKSLKDNRGNYREKILKQLKDKDGYLYVNLYKNRKMKGCKVHRLVAQTFIHNPNINHYTQINHIDEIKSNNCIENLEWCTCNYNVNYGTRTERMSKSNTNNIKRSKPVIGINKINGYICEFPSTHEVERVMGIAQADISRCCNGKQKSAGGYKWFYKYEEVKENE